LLELSIGGTLTPASGKARVNSEFWFYVEGIPELIKIQSLSEVTAYSGTNGSPTLTIQAADGTNSSMAGSVSDIYLIKE
jgi:hypothetical protein